VVVEGGGPHIDMLKLYDPGSSFDGDLSLVSLVVRGVVAIIPSLLLPKPTKRRAAASTPSPASRATISAVDKVATISAAEKHRVSSQEKVRNGLCAVAVCGREHCATATIQYQVGNARTRDAWVG
jgi:hypothetical protein